MASSTRCPTAIGPRPLIAVAQAAGKVPSCSQPRNGTGPCTTMSRSIVTYSGSPMRTQRMPSAVGRSARHAPAEVISAASAGLKKQETAASRNAAG